MTRMTDITLDATPPHPRSRSLMDRDYLWQLTIAALLLGSACRLFAGIQTPLWLDETFSAEIASQHNVHDFLRWSLTEMSGPVYYAALFLWEKLAGNGNVALRLPSLALSLATPLIILRYGHHDVKVRQLWAAFTALSVFGFDTATEARPYALILMLGCIQALIFLKMIEAPRTRTALAWTSVSALMVLTHYHAAILCGLQGIAYLALCRMRAVRTWSAAAPLVPMAIWMAYHLPFLFRFASKDTTWYQPLHADALWLIPALLTGLIWPGVMVLTAMTATTARDIWATTLGRKSWPFSSGETALFATGALAVALVMAAGFLAPTFSPRYLLPFVPALLAGMAIWTRRMIRQFPLAGAVLLCIMLGSAASQLAGYIRHPEEDHRYVLNFEQPSQWIAAQGADRLIFLWDNPTASLPDPDHHLASVASFFLRRDHVPVETIVPPWPRHGDPNLLLNAVAGQRARTAILWAYDINVPGTRGRTHPWRLPQIDARWRCRVFGKGSITVLACVR